MGNRVGTKSLRLRIDQFDLIVIMAERIYDVAVSSTSSNDSSVVVGRRVLLKRCKELIADVRTVYPDAGK